MFFGNEIKNDLRDVKNFSSKTNRHCMLSHNVFPYYLKFSYSVGSKSGEVFGCKFVMMELVIENDTIIKIMLHFDILDLNFCSLLYWGYTLRLIELKQESVAELLEFKFFSSILTENDVH